MEPLCKYFGKCNGCTAQHIDYQLQLENKKKALARAVKFDESDVGLLYGPDYGYRNRMDFFFSMKRIGLRDKNNPGKIIDIEKCVISNKKLNELLSEIRKFFKDSNGADFDDFDFKERTGTFRQAIIRAPEHDSAICFVLNSEGNIEEALEKIKEFAKITTANNIIAIFVEPDSDDNFSDEFVVVKGSDLIKEKYLGKTFWFSAQVFFQNNHKMAEKMQEYCHELLKKYIADTTKDAHLLDLYAGVGTFGIINSNLFKTTTIVESVKPAIECANKNIKENNVKNARTFALDAKQLRRVDLQKPLFVITDPPRSGMDEKTIETLKSLKPEVIIYISCNVQQLAKDIPKFKNYEVKSAALFDLFPQTNHSESVVELVLRKL